MLNIISLLLDALNVTFHVFAHFSIFFKSAAKIVTGALHYSSRIKLERELGWEPFQIRADFLGLTLFKKITMGQTRPLLKKCMTDPDDGNYITRNKGGLKRHPFKSVNLRQSFFPYYTILWNNIPERKIYDFDQFKKSLKNRLKPKKYKFYA